MGRRVKRAMARLERIHRKRLLEQAERIRQCVERDACEEVKCRYYPLKEDVSELIQFAAEILAEGLPEEDGAEKPEGGEAEEAGSQEEDGAAISEGETGKNI